MDSCAGGEPHNRPPGWEPLALGVARRRLPGVDATTGMVRGARGVLVVDTGGTLREGAEIARSVRAAAGRPVSYAVLTHAHWDHCLGTPAFPGAGVVGHRGITARLDPEDLAADAVRCGVAPAVAREAADALVRPDLLVDGVLVIDLGGVTVTLFHPGPAHTDHDLAVVVRSDRTVVFCGDLVEESGPPQAGPDASPEHWPAALDRLLAEGGGDALYVPGHGAVVDADFVRGQRDAPERMRTQ